MNGHMPCTRGIRRPDPAAHTVGGEPPVTVHSLLVDYDSMSVPVPGLSGVTRHIILYGKLSLILCNMPRIKNRILVWSQVMQMMTVD